MRGMAGRRPIGLWLDGLRRAVEKHAWAEVSPGLTVTCSIGVTLSRAGKDVAAMLERADAALYRAKKGGRNAVCMS